MPSVKIHGHQRQSLLLVRKNFHLRSHRRANFRSLSRAACNRSGAMQVRIQRPSGYISIVSRVRHRRLHCLGQAWYVHSRPLQSPSCVMVPYQQAFLFSFLASLIVSTKAKSSSKRGECSFALLLGYATCFASSDWQDQSSS